MLTEKLLSKDEDRYENAFETVNTVPKQYPDNKFVVISNKNETFLAIKIKKVWYRITMSEV